MSVVVSVVAGFVLLFAITWSIQDYEARADDRAGLRRRRSSSTRPASDLGTFLLFICVVAQFFCGMASVTANSRMAYAFSRDGALPGSRLWSGSTPHRHADQLDLAVRGLLHAAGAAVAVEHHRLPGRHRRSR